MRGVKLIFSAVCMLGCGMATGAIRSQQAENAAKDTGGPLKKP